jgi:hypothetical protein
MHWLSEGDLSTKFFHMSATARSKAKKIERLITDEHNEVRSQGEVCAVAKQYFDQLFKAKVSSHEPVLALIEPRINDEDNMRLLAPITKEEIHQALLQMHPDKRHWKLEGESN